MKQSTTGIKIAAELQSIFAKIFNMASLYLLSSQSLSGKTIEIQDFFGLAKILKT